MIRRSLALALALVLLVPAISEAQQPLQLTPPELSWNPKWDRFEGFDYAFSGALIAGLAASYLAFSPSETRIEGGVLFDDAVRRTLRFKSESARQTAGEVSNVVQNVLIAYPFVADAGLAAWLGGDSGEVAWQLFAIDAQSFLLTGLVTLLSKNLSDRARPYVDTCGNTTCGSSGRNKSFISGHAAASFTGAGLICAHHQSLALYGDSALGQVSCIGGLGLATATSILRVASDDHFATDVLAGAIVGLISGYLLPRLLYFSED